MLGLGLVLKVIEVDKLLKLGWWIFLFVLNCNIILLVMLVIMFICGNMKL